MANVTVTDQHEEVGGGDASYLAIDERNYPSLRFRGIGRVQADLAV